MLGIVEYVDFSADSFCGYQEWVLWADAGAVDFTIVVDLLDNGDAAGGRTKSTNFASFLIVASVVSQGRHK